MEFLGPLRRVVAGPDHRWPPRPRRFHAYAVPLGLLALAGLGLINGQYLLGNRHTPQFFAAMLSIWAVLPVLLAFRRPLLAWRVAYPLLFLGVVGAGPAEPWPWTTVQILAFLFVVAALVFREDPAVMGWVTALNMLPLFLFAPRGNAWGVALLFVAMALAGDLASRRRHNKAALAEQAELTELEKARRAVLEERARIAREMHDVVAHHMSMIAVQAETAPYRLTGLPEPVEAEFGMIAAGAREALTDMRQLLGVLRSESEDSPLAPQPGLAEVAALVETARRAGVTVSFVSESLERVPVAAQLAAYRIVQEALANAARHAPGGPVTVTVRSSAGVLLVQVCNEAGARAAVTGGAGLGLVGMRERAALLGGTLEAGPRSGGGYRVEARLPLPHPTRSVAGAPALEERR